MGSISKKELLFFILGVAVIAVIILYGSKMSKQPIQPVVSDTQPTSILWSTLAIEKGELQEETDAYNIRVFYPITQSGSVSAQFKTFAEEQIATFKKDIVDYPVDETAQQSALFIDYVEQKYKTADNYVFTIVTDTGGAHGLQSTRTFSYDQNGQLIELKDVFTDVPNGLARIAVYVQAELGKREFADATWIKEGASPTESNYKIFVVTDEGIRVLFDPYHVAPYAAGLQSVDVPLRVFAVYANKDLFTTPE